MSRPCPSEELDVGALRTPPVALVCAALVSWHRFDLGNQPKVVIGEIGPNGFGELGGFGERAQSVFER